MEKLLKLLPWLNVSQALKLLEKRTDTPVSSHDLLQLCDFGHCSVYLDCHGWKGEIAIDIGEEVPMYQPVTGRGFCLVEYPLQLADDSRHGIHVIGPALVVATRKVIEDCAWWVPECGTSLRPVFNLADIEALAAKMNGENEQPSDRAAEAEDLRTQWEQERLAEMLERRKEADDEARDRAYSIAITTDERLRAALEQEQVARKAAEAEAKEAKSEAEHWRQQHELELECRLRTQSEGEALRQELEHEHAEARPELQFEPPAAGLTFPYATKELEAMRTAALKYWANHAPDKRHPTQKEIGHELCELLQLPRQANNDPARKAIVLATAIRPDTLIDA